MFILQLTDAQSGDWIETNAAGELVSQQAIAALSDCPKINSGEVLAILIPGEQVTLMTVKLPKMRAQERVRAVPFALEEQLATDPESIYVAVCESDSDGTVTAAIVDKDRFDQDYTAWHEAELFPRVVLPDFLAVAFEPETWTIVFHHQMALVRTGLYSGFSIDANNIIVFLSLLLDKETTLKPTKIRCWQEDNVVSLKDLDKYAIPIEFCDATQQNKFDVKGIVTSQLNLLQGKYRPKMQASALKRNWLLCGAAAAAFFGFIFFSNIVQLIYWRHEASALQGQILQTYQTLFPGSKEVLEPRFRTKTLLKRYQEASHSSVFLKLFRAAGSTLLHFPDIRVQTMDYQNHELKLAVAVESDVMLSDWTTALRAEQVTVQQSSTKAADGSLQAEITVSNQS